ncbi:hypothetical protein [Microbacterium sp.]|uniref:hypothetical protein n=1 Tax=Microbacterium sp. TaxID=51671 RepID=UPI0032222147
MDFCVAVNGEVDAIVGSHEGSDLASEGFDCDLPELLGGETGPFADGVVVDWDACAVSPRTCRIARRVAVVDSESLKRAVAELVMADVELSPFTGNYDFVVVILDRAVNLGDP